MFYKELWCSEEILHSSETKERKLQKSYLPVSKNMKKSMTSTFSILVSFTFPQSQPHAQGDLRRACHRASPRSPCEGLEARF